MKFCALASGSSGNCIYVEHKGTRILVDAGISAKRIAASTTMTHRSSHSGRDSRRKAMPAAPIRFETTREGITPVATVSRYCLEGSFVLLP